MKNADIKKLTNAISYKWRVQSFSTYKPQASCVAYIDARDVMKALDDIVGPENWQDKYEFVGNKLIAGIGIKTEEGWVWKYDTGTTGNIEEEKSIFSDAFKRAGVKWGIGRFLYDLDIKYVPANEVKTNTNHPYVIDGQGKRVWDLTKHFDNKEIKTKAVDPTDEWQPKSETVVVPKEVKEVIKAEEHVCPIHNVKMNKFTKGTSTWYSHMVNGTFCNGYKLAAKK